MKFNFAANFESGAGLTQNIRPRRALAATVKVAAFSVPSVRNGMQFVQDSGEAHCGHVSLALGIKESVSNVDV